MKTKNIETAPKAPATIAALAASARHYGVTVSALLSKARTQKLATARHVAIFLVREAGGFTYQELANQFNRLDHSAMMNSVKQVEDMLATDINGEFAAELEDVRATFKLIIEGKAGDSNIGDLEDLQPFGTAAELFLWLGFRHGDVGLIVAHLREKELPAKAWLRQAARLYQAGGKTEVAMGVGGCAGE